MNLRRDDKKDTVITVKIKTSLPDLISGKETIPFEVPLNQTWRNVLQSQNITIDPERHYLKGKGQELDLSGRVLDFYELYTKNLDKYLITIFERPCRNKGVSHNKRKCISRVYAKDCVSNKRVCTRNNNHTWAKGAPSAPAHSAHHGHGREQQESANNSPGFNKNIQVVLPSNIPAPSTGPGKKEFHHGTNRTAVMDSGGFLIPSPRPPTHHSVKHQHAPQPGSSAMAHGDVFAKYIVRDETTRAGDVVNEGEEYIKNNIVRYILEHWSNRDMLEIREELMTLKRHKKFQGLNRLVRFTSGFLQNVFLDQC